MLMYSRVIGMRHINHLFIRHPPPNIYLPNKTYNALKIRVHCQEKVADALKTELDERNCVGGYNNKSLMEYFQG